MKQRVSCNLLVTNGHMCKSKKSYVVCDSNQFYEKQSNKKKEGQKKSVFAFFIFIL